MGSATASVLMAGWLARLPGNPRVRGSTSAQSHGDGKYIFFLFGNFILFKKVFYSNLSRGMLNLPVNVSFNGSDLKTFLSKIINSLMFLDHSHIISSLAKPIFFF